MKKVIFHINWKGYIIHMDTCFGKQCYSLHRFYSRNQILVAQSHVSVKGPNFFFNFEN